MAKNIEHYKRIAHERAEEAEVVRNGGMYPPEQNAADKEARREEAKKHKKNVKPDRMENIYKELISMSDVDISNRINDINTRTEEIEARRRDIFKAVKGITARYGRENIQDRLSSLNEEFEGLKKEVSDLRKEKERLERFPEIKNQIVRIKNLRDKTIENKKANLLKAKAELKEAKLALKERENNVKEIEAENKKIEKYQKKFAKNEDIKDEDREEYIASIKRLEVLREDTKKEYTPIQELKKNVKDASDKVKLYESGKSKEDSIINKCNMAWKMLLAGKSWDEISLAATYEFGEKEDNKKLDKVEPKKEIIEDIEIEPKEDVELDLRNEDIKPEQKKPEIERKPEIKKEEAKVEEIKAEEVSVNLPVEKKSFAEKHPILAKIPFVAKIADRIAKRREKKAYENKEDVLDKVVYEPEKADDLEPEKEYVEEISKEENKEEIGSKMQRDAFIEYLKEYANKETEQKKEFGGLEVERKAYEKLEKNESKQNEMEK